ncbi:MAG TPA: filamentous hemagglutinin N-terminal domain-containing protein, partial [Novosphingobium sp.]|nr:filamentous hemagglutinin N-terminal domain-containing protein [Novosphingobium sp.]
MRSCTASLRLRLLASTIVALASQNAFAQTVALPSGGSVGAGSATIGGSGSAVSINQTSNRAVINWNSFSIGAGGSVNVVQPGANSALLNRVTGNDVSQIAGSLTANGQVFLTNRNGILFDSTGKVDAHGGFIASTLDIRDDDFMAGRLAFAGSGAGSIVNRGTIAGGAVALLGSSVSNIGTIVSPMGRVAIGAAQQATLDLNGDGFLQVAIPSALDGNGAPLIDQRGTIDVGGGLVVMRAATAREIVRQAINMSGIIRATSVSRDGGTVVLDGGDGGTVDVSGAIDASGVRGGQVDVSGGDVALSGATVAATGSARGGLVRIGGAFQGGAAGSAATAALSNRFDTRFGADRALRSARTTTIDAGSTIDVSGGAAGGSAVVWSEQRTRQLGTINASGAVGGAIELSSHGLLSTSLGKVATGRGGSLLLDPKNVFVYNSYQMPAGTTGDSLTGTAGYGDNPGADSIFNVLDIKTLIDGGTSVTLRASNDLTFNADLTVGFGGTPGNLVLSAGRSVSLAGYLTLNEANLSVTANDTLANGVVDADRDPGAASLDAFNAHISGSTASGSSGGNVTLKMASGAGVTNGQAGDMRLASISARSITIDAGDRTVSLFDYDGGPNPATLSAAEALSLTGALRIQTSDATLSGRTVSWTNEASALLTASSPGAILRFIENGALIRYGVLRGGETGGEGAAATDTVRLALGKGGTVPAYTSIYGDAYGAFDALHLMSGTLQSGDTLDGILASGSTTTTGPAAGQGVGDYAVTTSATAGFGFASGVSGYFVNLTGSTDVLRITPKALTPTVTAGAYTYGAPTAVANLGGLVGSDQVGLTATVSGLGTQALTGSGGAYSFAANLAAGQRSFTLTGLSGAAAANYTLDLSGMIGATLAIDPKTLTYAGTSASSIYGTLNTTGFILAGLLSGDDVSLGVAGVVRNGVTSALTATTGVGTYATIAGTLGGAAAGNYVLDTAHSSAGSAIIDPKALTYSTSNTTSTYGTLASIAAPTLSGVIAGDAVWATALLNNGNVALSARTAAGNYNINAVLTGAGAGNYVLTGASQVGVLSVGRLMIGASVANTSQVYESTSALATLNGVLFGDDVVATGLLDGSAEGRVGVGETGVGFTLPDVGTHRFDLIGITGTGASNYILDPATTRSAVLTVTPKPVNFSVGSLTTTYGDVIGGLTLSLTTPTRYALTAPIVVTNSATGASGLLSDAGRLGAGSYVLSAGALNPAAGSGNYIIAPSGNQLGALVITPKGLTYSALSASGTYGNGLLNPGAVLNG